MVDAIADAPSQQEQAVKKTPQEMAQNSLTKEAAVKERVVRLQREKTQTADLKQTDEAISAAKVEAIRQKMVDEGRARAEARQVAENRPKATVMKTYTVEGVTRPITVVGQDGQVDVAERKEDDMGKILQFPEQVKKEGVA